VIGITDIGDLGHRFDGFAGTKSSGTMVVVTVTLPSPESVGGAATTNLEIGKQGLEY
jgi:hypothetical protein